MIKINEIPKTIVTDKGDNYCIEERNEVYFLAYEANKEVRISVLWSDLKFIRKFFGTKKFDDTSNVTKKSLNFSRTQNIANLKQAIKLKININEIEKLQPDGSFGLVDNPKFNKLQPKGVHIDMREKIEYIPKPILDGEIVNYEKDIANGLFVICKYV